MKNWQYYLFIILTIGLSVFLRFFLLADKSLWLDEGASLEYSGAANAPAVITRLLSEDSGDRFQPLYYLVLFYWRQWFGNSEFALRSLSAVTGIGAVVVLYLTALRVYGKKHALWSGLLLAVSSYGVYYSQQTRAYALLLFLASLQLYFFSYALGKEGRSGEIISRWGFWITTGISLFCSILIGIFTLALSLSHLFVYRNLKRWLQWWLPAAFFCLPAVLFYLVSPFATAPNKVLVTFSTQPIIFNIAYAIYGLLVGETYGPPIENLRGDSKFQALLSYLPHLLILLIVSTILFLCLLGGLRHAEARKYQYSDRFFISLFIVSFILAFLFAVVTKLNWLPRHSFYIYLPLFILLPLALRNQSKVGFKSALAAILALLVLNVYSVSNYYFDQNYQREDYHQVTQYLQQHQSPNVKTVLLYGAPNLLPYYGDTSTINGLGLDTENLAVAVQNITNNSNKVIIAISYQDFWELKNNFSVEKSMSKLYSLQSKDSFTNFNVYHFVKK